MNAENKMHGNNIRRKKCLLLLPRPVFPLVCGYALKNYNLIRILASRYELHLVILSDRRLEAEERRYYEDLGVSVQVHRIPKWRSYLQALRGLFSTRPLQVCYYYDRGLQKKLCPLLQECDVLIAALVRTCEYLKPAETMPGKTIVFDMVDSIALNYMRSREKTESLFWKVLYGVEGGRLLRYERCCVENSSVTYLFNPQEQKYWKGFGRVERLPHGVNEMLFHYEKQDPKWKDAVVFIGKMDYQPNVDAAVWYMQKVHPMIAKEIPLVIVGAYPSEKVLSCARELPNVTVTGFVEDPYLYVNSAMAVVAPMQTGGGIQNKVLEGMALGKINILSSLAAKPIAGAKDGEHFLVADTPEEYVRLIREIAAKPEKYAAIGERARVLIEERYSWKRYGEMYLAGIEGNEK
ncbi:MAG: glycosyltransferase family 4 protein [Clostridiales bacterium]|nr:glycosyltransferase family 4 protein [Clostridiales bacterium]